MKSRFFIPLAILVLVAGGPARAVLFPTASAWVAVDAGDPGLTYDKANIAKALYPPSDPYGNAMVFPRKLTAYMTVPVRTVPGPEGAGQRVEDWAFDCAGKYAVLSTMDTDATGRVVLNTAVNTHNGATGASGETLGVGLWGPEHFMKPVEDKSPASKIQALVCTPEQTSLDPSSVTGLIQGHWHHGKLEKKSVGWDDGMIVHGRLGADEVTMKIDLVAEETRPRQSQLAMPQGGVLQAGVKVGLTADFSRRLDFFPTGHYPWGYKAVCKLAIIADGLDTGWGYDLSSPMYGVANLTARTPQAAYKLIDRVAEGNYEITVTCDDYKQPVVFHITQGVPQPLIDDFNGYVEAAGGLVPPSATQGL